MKTVFSMQWLRSVKPQKQRKFREYAPLHIRGKFLRAPLSKELRKKYGVRSLRLRTGDKVTITRGQFKKRTGTIDRVDLARQRVFVKGVELAKKDGGSVPYPLNPSKVMITSLHSDDKRRFKRANTKPTAAEVNK
ncbi:MAG: 50S ribosomal protein L24 [Candidatus Nanoarchaeia archaeon]